MAPHDAGEMACPLVEDVGLKEETRDAVDTVFITDEIAKEELRLIEEREEQTKTADTVATILPKKQFEDLHTLLNKSNLYTTFLAEQMRNDLDDVEGDKRTENSEETPSKSKRKHGQSKTPAKKAKVEEEAVLEAEVKSVCPLLEGGHLKAYQLKGVKWMIALWQNGLNGILADQMGLGKTIQTIAFLSHLYSKNVGGKFLVVGPLSTLSNWMNEFRKWTPKMKCLLYHGAKDVRQQLRDGGALMRAQAIVTSYEICMQDRPFLAKMNWCYVVIDEGHRLKNYDCRLIRELKIIASGHTNKLLLSGTPLQNNLAELWSLLNFLLPDVFTSLEKFENWFDFSSVANANDKDKERLAEQRSQIVSKLHDILKPFLLRRLKSEVEKCLPKKKEIILYAQMTRHQQEYTQKLLEDELGSLLQARNQNVRKGDLRSLNNVLMQLRKICNHPDLITSQFSDEVEYPPVKTLLDQCGKLKLLHRLLLKLKEKGHKVLIFSQMTRMLDLLQYYLEEEGFQPCRIDGSVAQHDRQSQIKAFNEDPAYSVFLLSTRAGGLGINLTAADTVIIYDSDWNPHQDLQAMDRCHRIGQQKPVHVYRLATANSVEGRMLERAASKLKLERLVITKGNFKQEEKEQSVSVQATEILDLIGATQQEQGVKSESGDDISEAALQKLLDRSDLRDGFKGRPFPKEGPGFKVVEAEDGRGLLSGVE